jgi:aspartokinase
VEKIKIGGILRYENLSMLRIQGLSSAKMNAEARLLTEFGLHKINIQFLVQLYNHTAQGHLTLAVAREDTKAAFDLLTRLQKPLGVHSIKLKINIASIGIYGPDFRLRPGIAGTFLKCLNERDIPIYAISTSVSTCSALIPESQASQAQTALEDCFLLP